MWGVPALASIESVSSVEQIDRVFAELDASVAASTDVSYVTDAIAAVLDIARELPFEVDAPDLAIVEGRLQQNATAVAALTDLLPALNASIAREQRRADRTRRRMRGAPAYGVSNASRGDSDNPSYRAAMNGPEKRFWEDACATEMHNLETHGAYRLVPEDSLPTSFTNKTMRVRCWPSASPRSWRAMLPCRRCSARQAARRGA